MPQSSKFSIALEEFASEIVRTAKLNLSIKKTRTYTATNVKSNRVASGTLKKSIYYEIKTRDSSGRFVDREVLISVKGAAAHYAHKVEYGTPPRSVKARDIMVDIWKWIRIKPVKLRDRSGRYTPMTEINVARAARNFAKAIARRGIPPEYFLRDAIIEQKKKFRTRLTQAALEDVKQALSNTIDGHN